MTTPRRKRMLLILSLVAGLLLLGGILGALVPSLRSKPADETVGAAPFDQADFDAYWNSGIIPSTRDAVTSVDWSDGALTAHTTLAAKPEAMQPAMTICQALGTYWAGKTFQPVRVLDGAGQILTSRHSAGDTCQWRR